MHETERGIVAVLTKKEKTVNVKKPSANMTAFVLIACSTLLGFIFGLIKGEDNLNSVQYALDSMIAKERAATEQRQIVNDLMRVARNTDFLREMPQDQAMLWTTMVQMATPSPESSATTEWSPGVVPIAVSISEPETGISCHVIVGTVDTTGMNNSNLRSVSVKPCLVYYIGARPGQTFRFDNLNNMSTARYYSGYGTGYVRFEQDFDPAPMADITRRLLTTKFIGNN